MEGRGTLSKNRAIRQQQLICDPQGPVRGSTSTLYDPTVVSLSGFESAPNYAASGFVEVLCEGGPMLQPLGEFLTNPAGPETGYAQVTFSLAAKAASAPVPVLPVQGVTAVATGAIQPPAGFQVTRNAGLPGADTHAFFFTYKYGVPDTAVAHYVIYADIGNRSSENSPDSLTGIDPATGRAFTVGYKDLAPALLSGSLASVPRPAAFWPGLIGLGAAVTVGVGRKGARRGRLVA